MKNRCAWILGAWILSSVATPAQVTGFWNLAAGNWSTQVSPADLASNDLAFIAGNVGAGRTVTNDISVSLGGMFIGYQGASSRAINLRPLGDATIAFTNLAGGVAWLIKTNNANAAGSATDTIFTPIVLGASLSVSNRSTYGGLTIAGTISEVGGSRALYVGTSVAANSNRVTLSGDNSFSGGVFLHSGALQLGHVNALGTGALTMQGGALGTVADLSGGAGVTNAIVLAAAGVVSNQNNLQLSGGISGAFSLAKWGTGALILSGDNSFSGGSSLRAGSLLLGHTNALGTGALTVNGGVLGASTDLSAGAGVTNAVVLGAGSIVSNVNALQLSGNISGAFSLTKKGSGTLTLAGANTFGGPLVVSNGMVALARQVSLYNNTPASWTAANIIVATNATLGLRVGGAGEFTASDVQTIAGLGTGSGGFANGSFLALDTTGGDFVYGNVLANPNAGANVLGLVKLGANALTLGAANTFTGGTTVNGGTLRLGLDEALADTGVLTVNSGGVFDLNGYDETVWCLAGTAGGIITNSGALADLILDLQNCNNRTASMDIAGDLRLVVRNSQTIRSATTADQDFQQLNGTNTFTGGLVIDGGVVRANNDLALGAVPASFDADAVVLKNGGALLGTVTYDLEIHPNRGIFLESGTGMLWTAFNSTPRVMTVWSRISGPGSLLVTGDSKLLLMDSNSYEGITIVTQATLRVGHDLALSTNAIVLGTGATLTTVSNAPRTLANALVLADNVSMGATTIHNGVLTLTGGVDLGGVARTLSVYSQVEISGMVSNGGLARAQVGVLTLSGSNSYALGTTLGDSSGRLRVGNDDALGSGGVSMGRTTLTATGGVARVLTNHFTFTSNPTFGATSVDNGALTLNSINLGVATRTVTNHSALAVTGVISNGNWSKYGAGVLTLSGANTFTNFSLYQGVLAVGADNVLGVGILDFQGGQIQAADATARTLTNRVTLSAGTTIWGAAGTGDLTFNGSEWNNGAAAKNLYVSNNLTTINAAWTNMNASVTKLGPGTLAFGSTLAGSNWIVAGGTLRLDAGGGLTNAATVVAVGEGATFDVSAKAGWQMLGRQVLAGNGTVAGDVLTADGVRLIAGSTGTVGTLTFADDLTQTAGTTNLLDLGALTGAGGGTNDLIAVVGDLSAGSARISVNPLQPLTTGTAYTLLTYGGVLSGSFGGVDVPDTRYTGVLAAGGGAVTVTFSGSPLALTWSGSAAAGAAGSTWDLNSSANWAAGAEKFYTMDSVTFDDSTASNTVTLTGLLRPQSILVQGPSNYTFGGTGKISGIASLTKTGDGVLTVNTANDFDGTVLVSGGILKLGSTGALGSAVGGTIVTNGGTLDLNAKRYDNQDEAFLVSGSGVGGTGAVVNTGTGLANQGLRNLTLAGDTTVGGPNRFDIFGTFDGGTYTLTKTGGAEVGIQATNVSVGSVVIDGGLLTVFNGAGLGGVAYDTTINNGARLNLYNGFTLDEALNFTAGGTLSIASGGTTTNVLTGAIAANGGILTLDTAKVGYFLGAITGDGALTKASSGVVQLDGTNTYAGETTIANGVLALGAYGSISNTPSITIANGRLFDVSQVVGGWTLYEHQTLAGAGSVAGNVTALGTLRPGASPGTMTYSNDLTLSDADLVFELASAGTVGGGVNDLVDVLGNLTALGTNAIVVTTLAGLAPQYTLIAYDGTLTGAATNFSVTLDAPAMRPSYTLGLSDATPGELRLLVANSFSNLLWSAGDGTWDTTNTVAWNANTEKFYQGDAVVFNDAGASGATTTVTVADRVAPNGIIVSSSVDYVLGGSGTIGGDTWLVKEGAGRLTVSMTNAFTGDVWVNEGILRLGVSNLTLGAAGGKVYVTNGLGTLDLNRGTMVGKEVVIAGAGVDGQGALINSGGVARHGLRLLTLAGDATVGGTGNFYLGDAGSVLGTGGQAFNLTKVGNNTFYLNTTLVDPALADIFVQGGMLRYENALTNGLGDVTRSVYLSSNTTFSMYRATLGLDKRFVASGGSTINAADGRADWLEGNGLTNTLRGTIILTNGAVTFNAAAGLRLVGTVEGPGDMVKTGASDLWLTGTNTYTGSTTIKNGRILLGSNGQFTATSLISVQAGSLVLQNDRTVFQNRIGDAIPVVLAGGALVMRGQNGAGAVSETAGILSSGNGTTGVIDLWNGTNAGVDSVNLYFSGYDPGYGILNVFATNGTGVLGAGVTNTANPHLYLTGMSDGIVPRMFVATTNFARYSTLNGVSAAIPTASFDGVADQTGLDTWFTSVRSGESDALSANRSISTLTITSPGTTRTNLNLAGFALDAGGIWLNGANRFAIIDTVGGGSLSGANLQFRLMSSTMRVDAVISGAGTLDVSGSNFMLVLASNNTYTGETRISGGNVYLASGSALGTDAGGTALAGGNGTTGFNLYLQGGVTVATERLTLYGNSTGRAYLSNASGTNGWGGDIVLSGDANVLGLQSSSGLLTVSGDVSGIATNGSLVTLRGGAAGILTGDLVITGRISKTDDGTWKIGAPGKTYAWDALSIARGGLIMGAANVLPAAIPLTLGEGTTTTAYLDLNGYDQTIAGLQTNSGVTGAANVRNAGLAPATLTISNALDYVWNKTISDGATTNPLTVLHLVKDGAGVQTFATSTTYRGVTTIKGGTLVAAHALALQYTTVSNWTAGGLAFSGGTAFTLGQLAGDSGLDLTNAAGAAISLAVGNNGGDSVYGGILGGAGSLVKVGSGSLTMTAAGTYAGGTTVSNGALQLADDNLLGSGTLTLSGGTLASDSGSARTLTNAIAITVASGLGSAVNDGRLVLSGAVDFSGASRTITNFSDAVFSGSSGNGGFGNKRGPGSLTFLGGVHDWQKGGPVVVEDGALILDGALVTNQDAFRVTSPFADGLARLVVTNGAVLVSTNAAANLRIGYTGGSVSATNILDLSGRIVMNTSANAGNLQMGTASALAVANLLAGGELEVATVTNMGGGTTVVNFDGGILRARENSARFMAGLDQVNVRAGGAVIDVQAFNITVGQPLLDGGGAGGLTKQGAGILSLTGTNTYTGTTRVMAGVLDLAGSGSVDTSTTLQIDAGAEIVATNLVSTMHLKSGQTLKGNGTFTGGLIADSGSVVAPGASAGTLTVSGTHAVTMDAGSTFSVELLNDSNYDQLVFSGGATLTLNSPDLLVTLLPGYVLNLDDTFQIVTGGAGFLAGSFGGKPENATFQDAGGNVTFRINYGADDITLTVIPEPGSLGLVGLVGLAGWLLRRRRS